MGGRGSNRPKKRVPEDCTNYADRGKRRRGRFKAQRKTQGIRVHKTEGDLQNRRDQGRVEMSPKGCKTKTAGEVSREKTIDVKKNCEREKKGTNGSK